MWALLVKVLSLTKQVRVVSLIDHISLVLQGQSSERIGLILDYIGGVLRFISNLSLI